MPDTSDQKSLSVPESQPVALDAGVWAAMSHEIRTPLMGVVGMLEILGRTGLTDEQRRIIATAGESSVALMRIVDDVLDLAKLESTRLPLIPVATDLMDLLEGCTELLANQAEPKGLTITCEVGADVPAVMCDAMRLRQVLLNIGVNAVKFTESGHVALAVEATRHAAGAVKVRFSIVDSGIGIPPELHAFLFRPFSQLAVAAGRGHGGVGLGLAICRNLIEAMDGKITVESAAGKGTRFSIDLVFPLAQGDAIAAPRLVGVSVVAVDAGEPALDIAVRYLEAAGANVNRVDGLSTLGAGGLAEFHLGSRASGEENLVFIIGPNAEAEDVQAATATLSRGEGRARPIVLWLHPRAVGGAQVLARRGVRAIRAHPLRRAALFAAIADARPLLSDFDAPVLTRQVRQQSFGSDDEETAAAARAEGRVVLVAEDNLVNQQVLRQQLAILGFDCDVANNGAAALQALRERSYLLLLCDCHMPGVDGFELTRLIRADEKQSGVHLPIIAITANAMPGESERCRAAGMDDYLAKPIEISGLQAKLERWLDANWHPVRVETPSGAAPVTAAGIDLKNLKAVFGNDPNRLKPVLDQWRVVIEDAADDVRRALASGRWADMAPAVHRIKGSAGIAGAHGLSAAAAALEPVLRAGESSEIARLSARVLEYIAAALDEVQLWNNAATGERAGYAAFSATAASDANR